MTGQHPLRRGKWFTGIVVAAAVIEALDGLDLHYPRVGKEKRKELAAALHAARGRCRT